MGKSAVLAHVEAWCAEHLRETSVASTTCRAPIGSMGTDSIRPLQPFGDAIERLFVASESQAKKRLAMNIGMSVLASLPIAGDLFYAVKAISQDVGEYRKETSALQAKKQAAVRECVDTLKNIAAKKPLIILADDVHWADPQSVEVLSLLLTEVVDVPIAVIVTVTPSIMRRHNAALTSLLSTELAVSRTILVDAVASTDVPLIARQAVPHVNVSDTAAQRIGERSGGNPGIIIEYVRYLDRNGHIAADGSIDEGGLQEVSAGLGDHPATQALIADVSEEDALLLSLAAAEGQECTVHMIAALTNTDAVSTVRRLRTLQRDTGLIRSVGVKTRYGVKTTTYEFTQSFAYTYFLHFPEYEERKAIHQRMAEILLAQMETTDITELRDQLASIVAVHSLEAEDVTTARRMIGVAPATTTAVAALLRNDADQSSDEVEATTTQATPNAQAGAGPTAGSRAIVRSVADAIVSGDTRRAAQIASDALLHTSTFTTSERVVLLCLHARALAELGHLHEAVRALSEAEPLAISSKRDQCTILNVRSVVERLRGDHVASERALHDAARLARELPTASRILTMGNILLQLRSTDHPDADRHERAMQRLLQHSSLGALRADLRL
jgi:hypothetical protein